MSSREELNEMLRKYDEINEKIRKLQNWKNAQKSAECCVMCVDMDKLDKELHNE